MGKEGMIYYRVFFTIFAIYPVYIYFFFKKKMNERIDSGQLENKSMIKTRHFMLSNYASISN